MEHVVFVLNHTQPVKAIIFTLMEQIFANVSDVKINCYILLKFSPFVLQDETYCQSQLLKNLSNYKNELVCDYKQCYYLNVV